MKLKKRQAYVFYAWLDQRGYEGPQELHQGIEQALNFIDIHGSSRFDNLDIKDEQRIPNCAGWKKTEDNGVQYWIFPQVFRTEVCNGFNPDTISNELIARGILKTEGNRNTVQKKSRGVNKRMYHFVFSGLDMESKNPEHN